CLAVIHRKFQPTLRMSTVLRCEQGNRDAVSLRRGGGRCRLHWGRRILGRCAARFPVLERAAHCWRVAGAHNRQRGRDSGFKRAGSTTDGSSAASKMTNEMRRSGIPEKRFPTLFLLASNAIPHRFYPTELGPDKSPR